MPRVEANAKDPNLQTHQSWGWLTVGIRRILPFFLIPQANQWTNNWMEEELKMTAWSCVRLLLSSCKRFYVVKSDYLTNLENLEMDGIVKTMKLLTAILLWFLPREQWVHGSCKGSTGDSLVRKLYRCPEALGNDANKKCAFRRHWCMRIQHDLGPRTNSASSDL